MSLKVWRERVNASKLKRFVRKCWLPVSGLVLSTGLAIWFASTFLAEALYFNDPKHQEAELKKWMTPRYIVLSYDIPRPVVLKLLNLTEEDASQGNRIGKLAEGMGLTLDELTQKFRSAAKDIRETEQ